MARMLITQRKRRRIKARARIWASPPNSTFDTFPICPEKGQC